MILTSGNVSAGCADPCAGIDSVMTCARGMERAPVAEGAQTGGVCGFHQEEAS